MTEQEAKTMRDRFIRKWLEEHNGPWSVLNSMSDQLKEIKSLGYTIPPKIIEYSELNGRPI